ncbi:MAG: precorrin-6y C5,15-methyltransferase (decarboxylating) subunit CbiE, partial [Desulfobacterales bacterium]|nr:precorrin-6y C5,15-methyltransferase (decarboxylating) subunit CbiE [Desulfobacterales bacterium]
MNPVHVVGIGLGIEDLTEKHCQIIRHSDVLVGGRRHLGYFKDYPGEKLLITGDVQKVFKQINDRMQNSRVVVIASGDPNFFGIGPSLVEYLGEDNVVIHPNISVAAAAFSRIKLSWHDAVVVSLHGGKSEKEVLDTIIKKDKVAVFTDSKRTPAWLACKLIEINQDNLRVCIFEDLGSSNEHFAWYSPKEAAGKEFAALNIVIIVRAGNQRRQMPVAYFGMPEDAYTHEKGLITKTEVRAVAIAKLCLFPHHVL